LDHGLVQYRALTTIREHFVPSMLLVRLLACARLCVFLIFRIPSPALNCATVLLGSDGVANP
jgi:hypothetical protein